MSGRLLVACEESQAVCLAFRRYGIEAFSADIQECSGGHPEWHIQGDVTEVLYDNWDMIIAFPPCTYLSNAGSNRLRINGEIQLDRMKLASDAKSFFMLFYDHPCKRVAIENPVPGAIHGLPPYSQIIQPWWFGDEWEKRTCLWLRRLPGLMATELCVPEGHWVHSKVRYHNDPLHGHRSAKLRSKTFPGVANAMAAQWHGLVGV